MIQSELHECLKDGRPLLEHGYFNTHEELFGVLERAHSATFAESASPAEWCQVFIISQSISTGHSLGATHS